MNNNEMVQEDLIMEADFQEVKETEGSILDSVEVEKQAEEEYEGIEIADEEEVLNTIADGLSDAELAFLAEAKEEAEVLKASEPVEKKEEVKAEVKDKTHYVEAIKEEKKGINGLSDEYITKYSPVYESIRAIEALYIDDPSDFGKELNKVTVEIAERYFDGVEIPESVVKTVQDINKMMDEMNQTSIEIAISYIADDLGLIDVPPLSAAANATFEVEKERINKIEDEIIEKEEDVESTIDEKKEDIKEAEAAEVKEDIKEKFEKKEEPVEDAKVEEEPEVMKEPVEDFKTEVKKASTDSSQCKFATMPLKGFARMFRDIVVKGL